MFTKNIILLNVNKLLVRFVYPYTNESYENFAVMKDQTLNA